MRLRWLARRIFGRSKSVDGQDDAATVLPGISINGHCPSSPLRLTGRVSGESKKKGTFLDVRHPTAAAGAGKTIERLRDLAKRYSVEVSEFPRPGSEP